MLSSLEAALVYLQHADPKVRLAALWISSERWPSDNRISLHCERLALSDPDEQVRAVAISSLGACYIGSRNNRISSLLATIVASEQNPKSLRFAAYIALLEVQGLSLLAHHPPLTEPESFMIPEGIDWNIVNRFAIGPKDL